LTRLSQRAASFWKHEIVGSSNELIERFAYGAL
jgi:hypothetical protein